MAAGREKEKISPERYFLLYAYPCSFVLVEQGRITEEKRKELEKKLLENKPLDRNELEHLFPAAFRRIKQLAEEMKKDTWNLGVIKDYFFGEKHNDFIDKGDGMYALVGQNFKDLCKVHKAKVIGRAGNVLTVKCGGMIKNVFATLVPNAKKGDMITTHLAFAVEKIS